MRTVAALPTRGDIGPMTMLAKALAMGGGHPDLAMRVANGMNAPDSVINAIKAPVPALWTGDTTVAGFADASTITTQFLPFIRNASLFYRIYENGMTRVPLKTRVGFTTATATAFIAGEGAAVPVTRMEVEAGGVERAQAHALIVLTKEMIRAAGASGEALIARELRRGVSAAVDAEFIDMVVDSNTTVVTSSGNDAEAAAADLKALLDAVEPTAESRLLFGLAPDVARKASTLLTMAGGFLFPEMGPTGGRMLNVDAMVSDGLAAGSMMLLDATGLAGDSELINIKASGDTTIQMLDNPTNNSVTPTPTTLVSMTVGNRSMAMKAAEQIAKSVEHALEAGEMLLRDQGATEDEVAAFMVEHRAQMQLWANETLGEIRRSLSDWSAPSVKLQ